MSYAERSALDILIIDPDAGIGESLEKALRSHGINALALDTIEHVSDVIQNEHPALILTEYQLGDINGIDLTKQVMGDAMKVPEVILMYQKGAPTLSDAHDAGVCHLIQKPINIEELISIYKRYCTLENKRRFERVHVGGHEGALNAKLASETILQKITISDIGRGGFYFEVEAEKLNSKIGDVLTFEISLSMVPGNAFEAQGVIRWVREGFKKSGAGIEFLSLSADIEKMLQAYVDLFKVKAFVPKN